MAIGRSAVAGHGRTLNVHRESKGENIYQNYDWMRGQHYAKPPQQQNTPAQQQKPKPQSQQPATANSSGVASGKAQNAVNGKDLAGSFKFDDSSSDYSIEQVIKAQGFDGKPTVTTDRTAFASACKASNFIAKRGIGASDQNSMDAYDDALKNGDFYVKCSGGSAHGYGMYAASVSANGRNAASGVSHAEQTARSYAAGSRVQKTYTFTLDSSAKIGDEYTLSTQMRQDKQYQSVCSSSKMNRAYTADVGVYAAYKGYDAYIANSGRSSKSGSLSDYTVVLNRSKMIILN